MTIHTILENDMRSFTINFIAIKGLAVFSYMYHVVEDIVMEKRTKNSRNFGDKIAGINDP